MDIISNQREISNNEKHANKENCIRILP